MKKIIFPIVLIALILTMGFSGCNSKNKKPVETVQEAEISLEDSLFNLVQYQTFQYFWDGAEPVSGMARERIHMDNVYPQNDQNTVTLGGSGFGVMAILVGIERGFITREQALERFQRIVAYLGKADRFHGVWPHRLEGKTGKVKPFSKKDDGGDLVETAFMIQGLLTVAEYFEGGNDAEMFYLMVPDPDGDLTPGAGDGIDKDAVLRFTDNTVAHQFCDPSSFGAGLREHHLQIPIIPRRHQGREGQGHSCQCPGPGR